jgi:hypothetical protein
MGARASKWVLTVGIVLICLSLSGCAALREFIFGPPAPLAERSDVTHEVRYAGETLSLIAYWYTGKVDRWREIQLHNPALDAHKMKIGDIIQVPGNLVIRYTPLPSALVTRVRISTGPNPLVPSSNYRFRVNSITGCEDLGNSFYGLEACAARLEEQQPGSRALQGS